MNILTMASFLRISHWLGQRVDLGPVRVGKTGAVGYQYPQACLLLQGPQEGNHRKLTWPCHLSVKIKPFIYGGVSFHSFSYAQNGVHSLHAKALSLIPHSPLSTTAVTQKLGKEKNIFLTLEMPNLVTFLLCDFRKIPPPLTPALCPGQKQDPGFR